MSKSSPSTTLEAKKEKTLVAGNTAIETREFEFTADLAVELPADVDPKQFFNYLVRVMIAHTEAYAGSMGGSTDWHPYTAHNNE